MGKTIAAVAEAATAPPVDGAAPAPQPAASAGIGSPPRTAPVILPPKSAPTQAPARPVSAERKVPPPTNSQRLRASFWQPLAVFSGALWLRLTGTFFALLAGTLGTGAWRLRGSLGNPEQPVALHHLWLFSALAGLFAYFAVSSFWRANLRERRAAAPPRR